MHAITVEWLEAIATDCAGDAALSEAHQIGGRQPPTPAQILSMYRLVPPCTVTDTKKYVLVRTFGHFSVLVRTGTYWYVPLYKILEKYVLVCTIRTYIPVHTGTYQYIPP